MTAPARRAFVWLLPLCTAAVGHTLFSPSYQTNDDAAMSFYSAGQLLASEPSAYLMFVHPLVGLITSSLSAVAPGVAWYYAAHLATHYLSVVALAAAVLGRRGTVAGAVVFAGVYGPVDVILYAAPQFTVTAALAAAAAVGVWLNTPSGERWPLGRWAVFAALVLAAACWRRESCLLVFGFAAPLLAVRWVGGTLGVASGRAKALAGVRGLVPAAVAATMLALAGGSEAAAYAAHPGWRSFHADNTARAKLTDYKLAAYSADTAAAYEQVGWQPDDHAVYCGWCFLDRELFAPERVRVIAAAAPDPTPGKVPVSEVWATTVKLPHFPLLAATVGMLAGVARPTFARLGGLLLTAATAAAVWSWLGSSGRAPAWVFDAVAVGVLAVGMTAAAGDGGPGGGPLVRTLAGGAVVLTLAAVPAYQHHSKLSADAVTGHRALGEWLDRLDPQPDHLYYVWGSGFPFEWVRPWDDPRRYGRLKAYGFGCSTFTPLGERRLTEFGVTDTAAALLDRPNTYLLAPAGWEGLPQGFFARRRGVAVAFDRLPLPFGPPDPPQPFGVYRCRRLTPAGGTP